MAKIRIDNQIESATASGYKVIGKKDGETDWTGQDPKQVSPTTWIADDAGIYENTPGQFEIPSLPYAKDVDTVFSRGGKVFKYNAGGGYFELVFNSVGQVIEATENDIATFATNSGNYTFNSGDVIAIPDGGGGYNLFLYNGGTKTDTNSYLPLNVSQVDWSQVNNTPTTLVGYGITDAATSAQGDLADTAIQPGDNVSGLNNDVGYLTETTHDNLPQDNPHGVTASQVGLGNVDNTSDLNKPVSTAQQNAINQAEADAKQYTDNSISNLNLGSASQADVGDFATAGQGAKADTAIQPGDNMSELNDDTAFIDDVIAGGNITIDKSNPKKPVFYGQSAAVPEYASKNAAIADVGLGLNYPFSIEGDDTAYVKKDTGFVSTWDTTKTGVSNNDEIALPLVSGGTYNFDVWYGGQLLKTITTYTDNVIQFPDGAGTKEIICVGQLEGFRFAGGGDRLKILQVSDFGWGFGGTDFNGMFNGCSNLVSVGRLKTSGVTDFSLMFYVCSSLETVEGVSDWDMSSAINISNIFRNNTVLNSLDVSNWNVSNVTSMARSFQGCASISDLPVQNWNIENVTNAVDFAAFITIPTATYDQILTNWSAQNVNPSLNINFGNSKYSPAGLAGRDDLINNHLWTITDGGPV